METRKQYPHAHIFGRTDSAALSLPYNTTYAWSCTNDACSRLVSNIMRIFDRNGMRRSQQYICEAPYVVLVWFPVWALNWFCEAVQLSKTNYTITEPAQYSTWVAHANGLAKSRVLKASASWKDDSTCRSIITFHSLNQRFISSLHWCSSVPIRSVSCPCFHLEL